MNNPPPVPPNQGSEDLGQNAGMRMLLPVGRSTWAIVAGYFGLFAVIPFLAPLALITGIIAVVDIQKSKATAKPKHGMGRAIFGITMGVIFTLILIPTLLALLGS